MATVTGGEEGARDAAGRSLEQEQETQGTRPPTSRSNPPLTPAHIHKHTSGAAKKVFRGQEDSVHTEQLSSQRTVACFRSEGATMCQTQCKRIFNREKGVTKQK